MSRQVWNELWQDDGGFAGTLQNTYTTAKSVLNASSGLAQIPANYLKVGSKFKWSCGGAMSNRVTGPDTMTFQMMIGSVIACTSGAVNLTTTANTLASFLLEIMMTCTAVGNSTNAKFEGIFDIRSQSVAMAASLANNAGGTGFALGPLTSPAAGTGFDSTVANNVDFFVAQSVSNAGTGFDSTVANNVDFWVAQSVSNAGNGIRTDWWTFESLN